MSDKNSNTDFYYINQLLPKNYRIEKLIGRGGIGRVYQAANVSVGKIVAVKFLFQPVLNEQLHLFFQETAKSWAELGSQSPYVVQLIDYGISEIEQPYYIMEYLDGKTVKDLINARGMTLKSFLEISYQICLGLQAAHNKKNGAAIALARSQSIAPVIHGNIKPSNILVSPASNPNHVKIMEFAVARFLSKNISADFTVTGTYAGTLAYSSPEQIEGEEIDCRSDIYSLGVSMFEMLTGKQPWQLTHNSFVAWYKIHKYQQPHSFKFINEDLNLPKQLEDLVMSCMAKAPSDRPQNIKEILNNLKQLKQPFEVNDQKSSKGLKDKLQNEEKLKACIKETELSIKEVERKASSSIQFRCWNSKWPLDKPNLQIVFPNIISDFEESAASLWAMLPKQRIEEHHLNSRVANYFACLIEPYPMLFWLTLLDKPQQVPCWLPCFLDLKSYQAQKILNLLVNQKYYLLLSFTLEKPNNCVNFITVTINSAQANLIKTWMEASRIDTSKDKSEVSKRILKAKYESSKEEILNRGKNSYKEKDIDDEDDVKWIID